MRRRLALLAALPLAAVLAGCPFDGLGHEERVCTLELRSVGLPVVDGKGAPVVPTSATVTRADGTSLVCPASGNRPSTGCVDPLSQSQSARPSIVVVDDLVEVAEAGETIRVGARAGELSGTADLVIGNDGCHVRRISGPDALVLR